jgi:serine/threonine protein phosphatase PrpC
MWFTDQRKEWNKKIIIWSASLQFWVRPLWSWQQQNGERDNINIIVSTRIGNNWRNTKIGRIKQWNWNISKRKKMKCDVYEIKLQRRSFIPLSERC